jgi:hypothetical protein
VSQPWVGSDLKNHVDLVLCVAAMDLERPPVLGVLLERDLAGVRVDASPSPDRQDDGRREFRSSTSLGPTGMLTIVSGALRRGQHCRRPRRPFVDEESLPRVAKGDPAPQGLG